MIYHGPFGAGHREADVNGSASYRGRQGLLGHWRTQLQEYHEIFDYYRGFWRRVLSSILVLERNWDRRVRKPVPSRVVAPEQQGYDNFLEVIEPALCLWRWNAHPTHVENWVFKVEI